jgi:hypothetical protein
MAKCTFQSFLKELGIKTDKKPPKPVGYVGIEGVGMDYYKKPTKPRERVGIEDYCGNPKKQFQKGNT